MDVLKDAEKRTYDYISRYTPFNFYYHTKDDKYIYGMTNQLSDDVIYVEHKVIQRDTLDSLADYYYGRPDYYWIIADFNKIQDPLIVLWENFETIKIPSITTVSYKE